jgi:ABC-type cobalamin transport system ATPase subunit
MPKSLVRLLSLTLRGFRGYLEPKSFSFVTKKNLAIFAPNGFGKSALVDGVEFVLSKDGTIKRLGLRAVNNQAGPTALAHNLAAEKKMPSEVHVELSQGEITIETTRTITARTRPEALDNLAGLLNVDPIIRGHELRHFVEHQTPEERYSEVAKWLQLTLLVEAQKNLRLLRQQVKTDVWPAPGSEDTELGVLMEPEVDHGEAEVHTRVQA